MSTKKRMFTFMSYELHNNVVMIRKSFEMLVNFK
jgi:hypothetical protein